MALISGGELVVRTLRAAGVDEIFSIHGAHIEAIYQACIDHHLGLIDTRHEAAAGHAAEGYARAGRRLGVAVLTAGPGFTNAVTSIANAHVDRTPVLYIAGSPPLAGAETNVLQSGLDQVAVAAPMTRWAHRITVAADIPRLVAQAVRMATAGVPGPVFLDIPMDVLNAKVEADSVAIPESVLLDAAPAPQPEAVERALALLAAAGRPAIMAGAEVDRSGAGLALEAFADATGLPVFAEYEALGVLPPEHRLFAGTFWQLARLPAEAKPDLVLAFGVRFGWDAPGFRDDPSVRVIHVDLDPKEIGRFRPPAAAMIASSRTALAALNAAAATQTWPDRSAWAARVREAVAAVKPGDPAPPASGAGRIHPLEVGRAVVKIAGEAAIYVGDGALSKHWFDDVVAVRRPGRYLTHGALGVMGIGLGLSLGAKAAQPERPVVCVTGDGSFGFTLAEFDSLVRHNLPIVAVVMNNRSWGASEILQQRRGGPNRVLGTQLGEARYDQVVEALGGGGWHVTRIEELEPALSAALASGRPACVNVEVALAADAPAMRALTAS